MALAAIKDLLGQGVILPERKLRYFGKQPAVLSALQGKYRTWSSGDPLPTGVQKVHLLLWAYEDWLKRIYFEVLQVLRTGAMMKSNIHAAVQLHTYGSC